MKVDHKWVVFLGIALGASAAWAQTPVPAPESSPKETPMTTTAVGTFTVKVKPLPEDEKVAGVPVGRMSIDKAFQGDLEGTSAGEMMTAGTAVKGSAGYVAVEFVTGSLQGRKGTFTLMHHATMKENADFRMNIVVVPDSGTGELMGLAGKMEIIIEGGKHSYRFEYTLPPAK